MSKSKIVCVVTHGFEYEPTDVIATFKHFRKAKQYIEGMIGDRKHVYKEYDCGTHDWSIGPEYYQVKRFQVEE